MRPLTSEIVIACTSRTRYFDLDAVRTPHDEQYAQRRFVPSGGTKNAGHRDGAGWASTLSDVPTTFGNPAGAPPLDHWWHNDHTGPYDPPAEWEPTWPPDLCIKPILAMCPVKVCTTCGKPSERVTSVEYTHDASHANGKFAGDQPSGVVDGVNSIANYAHGRANKAVTTLGWSDCQHNTWRPGHVLDPFAGSGTTGVVATGHGRQFTGIDLDPRNHDLARQRIGMFLEQAEPGMAIIPTGDYL